MRHSQPSELTAIGCTGLSGLWFGKLPRLMDDRRKVFFSSGGRKDLLAELTEPNYSAYTVAPQLRCDGPRTSNCPTIYCLMGETKGGDQLVCLSVCKGTFKVQRIGGAQFFFSSNAAICDAGFLSFFLCSVVLMSVSTAESYWGDDMSLMKPY